MACRGTKKNKNKMQEFANFAKRDRLVKGRIKKERERKGRSEQNFLIFLPSV
jgi:hypothetical protein